MVVGYVLITTTPGKEREVREELQRIEEVNEVHTLLGEYSLIAEIDAKDFYVMGKIVVDKIRKLDGVLDTETLGGISFPSF